MPYPHGLALGMFLLDRRSHSLAIFQGGRSRQISSVGGSLRDVQILAGHSALTTTQRYIEGSEDAKRRVVEVA